MLLVRLEILVSRIDIVDTVTISKEIINITWSDGTLEESFTPLLAAYLQPMETGATAWMKTFTF